MTKKDLVQKFINVNPYEKDLDKIIETIIMFDTDDEAYLKMLRANPMSDTFNINEMDDFEKN